MNKKEIVAEFKKIELSCGKELPDVYIKFMSEVVGNKEFHEIINKHGDVVYIYNCGDVLERNEIYGIQDADENVLLIGQDGDMGYFIRLGEGDNKIYSVDLGALGALSMDEEASDLYDLGT